MLTSGASGDALLRSWPVPGFLVVFRAYEARSIDFDVDLWELQGQDGVDVLCRLLRAIGRRLGKPLLLSPESDPLHRFSASTSRPTEWCCWVARRSCDRHWLRLVEAAVTEHGEEDVRSSSREA